MPLAHVPELCHRTVTKLVTLLLATVTTVACTEPLIRRSSPRPPTARQLAEFWVDSNVGSRNLFWGPGGRTLAPENGSTFKFEELDTTGYSPGMDVEDADGLDWSVKSGPEAQTEVVASRLYWAVGYHQPPTYFVANWSVEGGPQSGPQTSARFRPDIGKVIGDWSLHENPFVGTQPYRGLLVLNVIVNNWDLKPSQNKIYEFEKPRDGLRRWYVVRDLGATFGKPRWPSGSRNEPDDYAVHPFIVGFKGDRPQFADQGRHDELLHQITRRDVRWISERLNRISDRQLADAFRAAGYPSDTSGRFIARLKEKITEGLALCPQGC